ncbi:hypothetical protein K440DRAFT_638106 [Wilcoxina mikolae CBS 423.85]|nr:hypothetical protein K440DRAFT_638106 [Wilcoxina mikolae CBS 423.85]
MPSQTAFASSSSASSRSISPRQLYERPGCIPRMYSSCSSSSSSRSVSRQLYERPGCIPRVRSQMSSSSSATGTASSQRGQITFQSSRTSRSGSEAAASLQPPKTQCSRTSRPGSKFVSRLPVAVSSLPAAVRKQPQERRLPTVIVKRQARDTRAVQPRPAWRVPGAKDSTLQPMTHGRVSVKTALPRPSSAVPRGKVGNRGAQVTSKKARSGPEVFRDVVCTLRWNGPIGGCDISASRTSEPSTPEVGPAHDEDRWDEELAPRAPFKAQVPIYPEAYGLPMPDCSGHIRSLATDIPAELPVIEEGTASSSGSVSGALLADEESSASGSPSQEREPSVTWSRLFSGCYGISAPKAETDLDTELSNKEERNVLFSTGLAQLEAQFDLEDWNNLDETVEEWLSNVPLEASLEGSLAAREENEEAGPIQSARRSSAWFLAYVAGLAASEASNEVEVDMGLGSTPVFTEEVPALTDESQGNESCKMAVRATRCSSSWFLDYVAKLAGSTEETAESGEETRAEPGVVSIPDALSEVDTPTSTDDSQDEGPWDECDPMELAMAGKLHLLDAIIAEDDLITQKQISWDLNKSPEVRERARQMVEHHRGYVETVLKYTGDLTWYDNLAKIPMDLAMELSGLRDSLDQLKETEKWWDDCYADHF